MNASTLRLSRRSFLGASAGLLAAAPHGGAERAPYSILLNSGFSGPQAFMFLAEDRGYLRETGQSVRFVGGDGAAAIVPRIVKEGFDFGYGDLSALVELAATDPTNAPRGIYTVFNVTPLTIAVANDGPIKEPKDLAGKKVIGHPIDAALVMFPVYAANARLDASKVTIVKSTNSMRANVEEVLAGKAAGCFGFVNTILAAMAPAGIGRSQLRFLEYREYTPDLYGNALMVRPDLINTAPRDIAAIVRALNHGLADTVKDPDAAVASVVKREPTVQAAVDRARLVGTIESEMSHPEGKRIGIGDVDDARLERAITQIVTAKSLPRTPKVREIFARDFLPPQGERIRTLAKG